MDVHHGWFSDNKEWIEYIVCGCRSVAAGEDVDLLEKGLGCTLPE